MKTFLFSITQLLVLLCAVCSHAQASDPADELKQMSLEEKIGQILIVGLYPSQKEAKQEDQLTSPIEYVEEAIQKYHVGAILCKRACDPISQRHLLAHFRKLSKRPLIAMQDLEWGLTMRHQMAPRFPKNLTLGAIQNEQLIYQLAQEIARQCKLIGIHMNLAPVVDVNSNPKNPIIGDRSFGEDPSTVAKLGVQYIRGLQDAGIAACAKHFPGHGDTELDSHFSLPTVSFTKQELFETQLIPFKAAIDNSVVSIMTAHILLPKIEPEALPASLSPTIIKELLQKELGFTGICMTDDLLMKAISTHYSPKIAAQMAFVAGNDMIMSSQNIAACFAGIYELMTVSPDLEQELDKRVLKILKLKQSIKDEEVESDHLDYDDLFSQQALTIKKRLYEAAITIPSTIDPHSCVLKNDAALLVQIGGKGFTPFYTTLKKAYPRLAFAYLSPDPSALERAALVKKMKEYNSCIVAFQEMNRQAQDDFGCSPSIKTFIKESRSTSPTFVLFGSPYALSFFEAGDRCVIAYEDDPDAQEAAANVLLGKLEAKGKLPVLRNVWK